MNKLGIVSIRDILNYNYCPRILYYEYVLRRPQGRTPKEDHGLSTHNEFVPRARRNKMVKRIEYNRKLFNLPLHSSKLNLQTVIDCVLINTYAKIGIPMQFKHGRAPPCLYRTMKYQLIAEAMLIEECFGLTCPYGLVKFLPEERTMRLEIDEAKKEELKKQLGEICSMVEGENYPSGPRTRNFCTDCCYHDRLCHGFEEAIS